MPLPHPPILYLPNEILHEIFSYLTCHETSIRFCEDFSDIFAIRGTCRTFRTISSELKFWYDDSFRISQLVRAPNNELGLFDEFDHDASFQGLIECLANDQRLVHTIGLKKEWSFTTFATLMSVIQYVPAFRNTPKSIDLELDPPRPGKNANSAPPLPSVNAAIAAMACCRGLVELCIVDERTKVSLDLIADSCLSLKELELYCHAGYTGSLNGLCHLEKLLVWDYDLGDDNRAREYLLPVSSASSLIDLSLNYIKGPAQNLYFSRFLHDFTNLTSLNIGPLSNSICDFLLESNYTNLLTFHTVVRKEIDAPLDKLIHIFTASSFSRLRTLKFLVEPFQEKFRPYYFPIIQAIISNLSRTLETLTLEVGLDSAWCTELVSLHELSEITWIVADPEIWVSEEISTLPPSMNQDDEAAPVWFSLDPVDVVFTKMKKEFEKFDREPDIGIIIVDDVDMWDDY